MIINIPENAKKLISALTAAGYKAYAVGGFVRDSIMGRSAGDVDITTSATPEQVESVLDSIGIKFFETGIKHGTVTAVIDREPYEITTFRTDGDYLDNRHPENVVYVTDLLDDLSRRDFTVNALAYNDDTGVVDEFGGIDDISLRLIRAVGDADKRFKEDALRIMRALRFAATLGFEIEEETAAAIINNKNLLLNIASERIYAELVKLITGDYCEDILLKYREVFAVIIPELEPCFNYPQHSKWHIYDVYTHIVKSTAIVDNRDYMRLAMLFHDIGKPFCKTTDDNGQDHFKGHPVISTEMADDILSRLHASNEVKNKVLTLIKYHDYYITQKPSNIKKWLRTLGEAMTLDYIDFKIADLLSHNLELSMPEIELLRQIMDKTVEIINSGEPYKISDLAINGNDLKEIGFVGHEIADELDRLINEVSGNPSLNSKEKLLHLAKADFKPNRKQNRLKNYDYATNGVYFITICTKDKECILSKIVSENNVGADTIRPSSIKYSKIGAIVDSAINQINSHYDSVFVDKYVIMPNHVHLMLCISNNSGRMVSAPTVVGSLKRYVSQQIGKSIWQKSFYDHIIRNEDDYYLHL
ncbi:MAG: HD domain-containing protein, partial [Eubacterium sp.]|nr:HD domain-containing protein [Eubacterium sp.]